MSRSSLSSMVLTGKGVEMGRLVSYSGALSGLASSSSSESAGRITTLGESPSGTGTTVSGSLSGLNLQTDGCWVSDQNLKMIKLRMTVFQSFPVSTPEGKYTMVSDLTGTVDGAGTNHGALSVGYKGVPDNFNDADIQKVRNALGGEDKNFKIGCGWDIRVLGYEYLKRYFPDPTINWKEGDMAKLAQKECLVAEVAFPTSGGNAKTIFIKCVDAGPKSKQVLDIMGCLFSLKEFKEIGITMQATDTTNARVKLFDDKYDFPLSNSSYDYVNGEIQGFSAKKLKEMGQNSTTQKTQFRNYGTTPETTVYCRFFVPRQFRDTAEKALGHKIPDAFTQYNGTVSIGESLSSVDVSGDISGTFEELKRKYRSASPQFSGEAISFTQNNTLRNNHNCSTTFVEVPWPCWAANVELTEIENGYRGIQSLSTTEARLKLLSSDRTSYSKAQYEKLWTDYESGGKVKIKMNSEIAQRVQSFFNDLASFYGKDIVMACPSFCFITCLSNTHNPRTSNGGISAHYGRCAIDFNGTYEKTNSNSDFYNHKNDTFKGALAIAQRYGAKWGGDFNDPMHFQWA